MEEWVKKHDPTMYCPQETHFKYNDTGKFKAKGWKKLYHISTNQRKAGVAELISDKVHFKAKKITRDGEGHYIMILGSIHQEDTEILNLDAPNNTATKSVRQNPVKRKREIDKLQLELETSTLFS